MFAKSVKVWKVFGKNPVIYRKIFLGKARQSHSLTIAQIHWCCVNTLTEQSLIKYQDCKTVRMSEEIYRDCLILGAGISGIDAAYYIQQYCPWASFLVLERRSNLGGTWDFFKYPGIRSDSDMYTFG